MIGKVSTVHTLSLKGGVYGDWRPLAPALGCLTLNVLWAADGLFQTQHPSSLARVPRWQADVLLVLLADWIYPYTGFTP